MYFNEMTPAAIRLFIAYILENVEQDHKAVSLILQFVNNLLNTDEIENEI